MSFTLTINNFSPVLEKRIQEVAVIQRCLQFAEQAVRQNNGLVTSGNIVLENGIAGSWTYTPQAAS